MGAAQDTDEFAAFLRGLKERSGRSYGQLAQRAHLSTSTLHRYCHGRAVPVEYAPVERLARLCGATPEELVGLHRRWVRADARRGRGAAEGAVTEDRAVDGRGAATDAGATAGDGEAAGCGEAEVAAGCGEEAPAAVAHASSGDGRRGVVRRWLWPVTALVALVAAVAVSAFVGQGPDGQGDRRPQGAGSVEDRGGVAGREGVPHPSASAEGREPSATSPEAAPQQAGRPAAEREQRQSGGSDGRDATGSPLAWTAGSHVWRHGCGHRYLVDRGPSEVPPPPVEQDARGWASALGAVHGGDTVVEATVRAAAEVPVVIEGVYVRVVDRAAPLGWPVYGMSNGCGGALTPAAFTVNLDAARPVAHPQDGYDGENGEQLPATRLPYQVTAGEPLVLRVEARTERYDCAWYLEVRWSSGGRTGTLRIDDGGGPFRTSGGGDGEVYGYDWGSGVWRTGA